MLRIVESKGWTISLVLTDARGKDCTHALSHHKDQGEALFGALEQLDDLVEGCGELQDLLELGELPELPGSPSLRQTSEGVQVKCGRGVLARTSGGRQHRHNVARVALENARTRLIAWRAEAQVRYDEAAQEGAA